MNDERKMVFVSGPVSSDPMGQIPKAIEVWNLLWERGYVPILPQLSVFQQMISPQGYETWMEYFDAIIMRCDVLYRLNGESEGADREVARAKEIGLEIWFDDGREPIPANYPKPEVPRYLLFGVPGQSKRFDPMRHGGGDYICTGSATCPLCPG